MLSGPLLDRKSRTIVYTDFLDEIVSLRQDTAESLSKMIRVQHEKKVPESSRSTDGFEIG